MAKALPFELKLALSKRFPPGTMVVEAGCYKLLPTPSASSEGEAVLSFVDSYEHPMAGGSHPEEEATMVARCLSLFIDARVKKAGVRINGVDIPSSPDRDRMGYPQFYGTCDPAGFEKHMAVFTSLPDDLARQFYRAATTYSFALEFIPGDPTFAFFLLVVAVECLSSQDAVVPYKDLNPDKHTCERFCRFISAMLTDDLRGPDERDQEFFTRLLKTAYYSHRSGFVHGGREVPHAALLADKVGSSYMKHLVDGKETFTPGLAWFARVVRGSLLGYLALVPVERLLPDGHRLSRLAFEKAAIQVKVKRDIQAREVVYFGDIEIR
jgi:hypothetical protein